MKNNITLILLTFCFLFAYGYTDDVMVKELSGKAYYRLPNKLKITSLKKGDFIPETAKIKIAKGSTLHLETKMGDVLTFKDKGYFNINENKSGLSSSLDATLILGKGKFKVHKLKSKSTFFVKTPTAVVGVRGTEFSIVVDDNGVSNIEVLEGVITVSASGKQKQVELKKGQKMSDGGGVEEATAQDTENDSSAEIIENLSDELQRISEDSATHVDIIFDLKDLNN
jgi:hypothetical protein